MVRGHLEEGASGLEHPAGAPKNWEEASGPLAAPRLRFAGMRGAPGGRVDSERKREKSENIYQIQLNTRETENTVPRSQTSNSHLDPAAPPPGTRA